MASISNIVSSCKGIEVRVSAFQHEEGFKVLFIVEMWF